MPKTGIAQQMRGLMLLLAASATIAARAHSRYNAVMKNLFLHGWQSTPGGLKPTFLNDHGHEVLNPHFPDDDFDGAVAIAQVK